MKLPIIDLSGKKSEYVTVADEVFSAPANVPLLSQVLHVYRTNQRQTPAKALTRGDVYGSRRKLWRQKGTGRARHGDRFAPQFVGGGVAHGPTGQENFTRKVNEKMRRQALFVALSVKQHEGSLEIIDRFGDHGKTGDVMKALIAFKKTAPILCVSAYLTGSMRRATKNAATVTFVTPNALNALIILAARSILIEKEALVLIEQHFLRRERRT